MSAATMEELQEELHRLEIRYQARTGTEGFLYASPGDHRGTRYVFCEEPPVYSLAEAVERMRKMLAAVEEVPHA